jgi:AraC-like DNA-binding protein
MNVRIAKRDAQRAQSNREELVERIAQALPEDGTLEAFPGFRLARSSEPTEPTRAIYQPAFCFVAQGSKQVMLGAEVFRYDPGNYLLFTVDLPLTFQVKEASKERPYLGFRLDLDPSLVASVMLESDVKPKKGDAAIKAMAVGETDVDLLDAIVRLVRLLDTPEASKALAPLIIREIVFRLLQGGQGARLSHLLVTGANTRRIAQAIGYLRENFNRSLRIEELAHQFGMSVSGFHHHFKSVTAMSPLQFQKQLRLQEARRLMLNENLDAASAGYRVGYDDPAYFNRDYKKLFGAPPQRDITRLRGALELKV